MRVVVAVIGLAVSDISALMAAAATRAGVNSSVATGTLAAHGENQR